MPGVACLTCRVASCSNSSLLRHVGKRHSCVTLSRPLDPTEGHSSANTKNGQNEKLVVERQLRRVEEGRGSRELREELENGESRGRVVVEDSADDGVHLGVEASVAEAQKEGAENGEVTVRSDERVAVGIAEWGVWGQVDEY